MNTKTEKNFIDRRFGFPVELRDVRMVHVHGEWVPDFNANSFRQAVLVALVFKPAALTGDEVHFVRLALEMTQTELADALGVTHPAISKWEGAEDTAMQRPTEFLLRYNLLMDLPIDELKVIFIGERHRILWPGH